MMEKREAIRVGIFTIISLTILLFGYFWLTEFRLKKEKNYYRIVFKEASWLKEGDPVTVMGVPRGRVDKLFLYPDSVVALVWLDDVKLLQGSRARLESQGIVGTMRISLTLGNGDTLPMFSSIPGISQKDLGQVISEVGFFLENMDSILLTFDKLITNLQQGIFETRKEVSVVFWEMQKSLITLREEIKNSFTGITYNLNRIDTLVSQLNKITMEINKGEGTLGKLLYDDEVYTKFKSTLEELESLIRDFREHPEKYLKIRIF